MKRSINLLPAERKNEIKIDKLNRFVFKIGFIVIFSIFLLFIFLLANFFIINIYRKINQDEMGRIEKGSLEEVIQESKREIDNRYSETEEAASEIKKRIDYWSYLNEINKLLPDNVFYSEITMEENQIKLRGLAKNREDLVRFKDSLEEANFFEKVEMPISNFTSQKNINFEIDLNSSKK